MHELHKGSPWKNKKTMSLMIPIGPPQLTPETDCFRIVYSYSDMVLDAYSAPRALPHTSIHSDRLPMGDPQGFQTPRGERVSKPASRKKHNGQGSTNVKVYLNPLQSAEILLGCTGIPRIGGSPCGYLGTSLPFC